MNDNYFRREKTLYGKHAMYMKELKDKEIFSRYIDVYKAAAPIGFLYNKKEIEDKFKNSLGKLEESKIFTEQVVRESKYLKINFQLIILLDKEYENDIELFESYVRGGIEILYEKCISDSTQKDDFMDNIINFLEELKIKYPKEYSL